VLDDRHQLADELMDEDLLDPPAGPARVARCVGVVGGRGGAGASTLAAALAVTAAASARAALLDLDPLGGGLDLLLGVEDAAGLRWPDLASAGGQLSAGALAAALPQASGVPVLSWDRGDLLAVPPDSVAAVVDAAVRGFDVVVLDLPRHVDPAVLPALSVCDLLLVVVPAEVRAVAAAARVVQLLSANARDLRVVVRGPAPSGLTGPDVARFLDLRLAGGLRPEPNLHRYHERGDPPAASGRGPLAVVSANLLRELLPGLAAAA
jgi:secretion/DNA translocation related CpaE-like protein